MTEQIDELIDELLILLNSKLPELKLGTDHPRGIIDEQIEELLPQHETDLLRFLLWDKSLGYVSVYRHLPQYPSAYDIVKQAINERLTAAAYQWWRENRG